MTETTSATLARWKSLSASMTLAVFVVIPLGVVAHVSAFATLPMQIAMAMVRIQQTEKQLAPFRKKVMGHIQETHETTMCKMGAIMALGILDAGGRNVTIGLRSRSGRPRMTSVLGMLVFTQYWYWYPLSYFLSLVFVLLH